MKTTYKLLIKPKGVEVADVVRRLERLEKRAPLTAKSVVDDAHDESSPLHNFFCWDDTEAARLYREDQARHLIRHIVRVTVRGDDFEDVETRAFVHVNVADEFQYVSIATVMKSADLRDQMLGSALRDLNNFERKYKNLTELSEVFAAIGSVRQQELTGAA